MADHEKVIDALEKLIDSEVGTLVEQREDRSERLRRIRAAIESDADLQARGVRGLRDFLLRETAIVSLLSDQGEADA